MWFFRCIFCFIRTKWSYLFGKGKIKKLKSVTERGSLVILFVNDLVKKDIKTERVSRHRRPATPSDPTYLCWLTTSLLSCASQRVKKHGEKNIKLFGTGSKDTCKSSQSARNIYVKMAKYQCATRTTNPSDISLDKQIKSVQTNLTIGRDKEVCPNPSKSILLWK